MSQEGTSEERLMTTKELANYLKVTTKTVTRWAQEGRIPCYRVSKRSIRFDLSEVRVALENGEKGEG